LAHPDESQRPLGEAAGDAHAAAGDGSAASISDSPRAILLVFGCFVVAFVALLAIYLSLTGPGAWLGSAAPRNIDAKTLAIAVGNGSMDGDTLVVAPADATGTIILTITAPISSATYNGVAWHATGIPAGTEARLLWRSEVRPGRTFSLVIPTEADRLAPVVASRDLNWIGPLNGIALALHLPTTEPVRISGVTLDPMNLRTQLAGRLRDWTTFEAWSGASINTVVGGADLQELPLPVLLGLAAMLATLFSVLIAYRRPRWFGAGLPIALAAMFLAAWLVLDARWQWNLAQQVGVTARTYAGLDWREKHVAAEDGALFEFIEKARAKLPPPPARVFMVADAHYFRGRGAYHLYPYNVYFNPWVNEIPPASLMHPGDFIAVYQRRGIQFDAAQRMLRWDGGPPVAAELLVVEPGAALFRLR
jgi:hypothetical protein